MPYVLYIQKITEKFFDRLETGFRWTKFPHIPYCLKSEIKKEPLFLEFEVSHSKLLLILLPLEFQSHTTHFFMHYFILPLSHVDIRLLPFAVRITPYTYNNDTASFTT